jgi:ribosomal protein S18 acetylase RimI-like enzyme
MAGSDAPRIELSPAGAPLPSGWAELRAIPPDDPPPSGLRTLAAYRDGALVARAAIGAGAGYAHAPGITGFVGWYESADRQAGAALLRRAARELLGKGAARVVGPLNATTWARYRLAEPGDEAGAPFLSEPTNPADYLDDFRAAGFRPWLSYETRRVARPAADARPWPGGGIRLAEIDLAGFEAELRDLYALSTSAFTANPLYTPVPYAEFAAQYLKMRPLLDTSLVLLARDSAGALQGYVFAFPDPLTPPRIVLKTLATAPEARGMGLGGALVDAIHRTAAKRGAEVLHALMQVSNTSKRISTRADSTLFRRYTLFAAEP